MSIFRPTNLVSASATFLCLAELVLAQATFQGLGDLPGGPFTSIARDVSADGTVVVGWSHTELGGEAFRWTATGGMQGLGDVPGGDFDSSAWGVSADGGLIVGHSANSRWRQSPFVWTPETGIRSLSPSQGIAFTVSADGSVIVGTDENDGTAPNRWVFDGTEWLRSPLPSGSTAKGISGNGLVAVGASSSLFNFSPVRWVETQIESLGGNGGEAIASSSDGSVIVGWTKFGGTEFAFRWVASRPPLERLRRLSDPSGLWSTSEALDVTADGSIVLGNGRTSQPPFVWDATNGMRELQSVLEHDFCLDLTGWALVAATGISDDGSTIVGYGTHPGGSTEAWIARIPPLAEADRDGDGTPNCADECPDDPGKIEPGVCDCGVPDVDTDKDGVLDCLDGCPNDTNKVEPGICGCNAADVDTDIDGLLDCLDNCPDHSNASQLDCDGNGVGDVCEIASGSSNDCNLNELPDNCDIAAMHDCCETLRGPGCNAAKIEACVCTLDPYCCKKEWDRLCVSRVADGTCGTCEMVSDCDQNGVPDTCDPDCNTNDSPDACDIAAGTSPDCQVNGIPDECEPDLDADGFIDDCDTDIDGDNVPNELDVCDRTKPHAPIDLDGRPLGDINLNCVLDLQDHEALVTCLSFSGPDDPPPLPSCLSAFDIDGDTDVDMTDVASFQRSFGP